MTTKEEEVLRLAKAAGLYRSGMHNNEYQWTGTESEITKLIGLAKAQGAAEDRGRIANNSLTNITNS